MGISVRAAVCLFMDPQFQYVRPGIVTHTVKLHAAGNGLLHIDLTRNEPEQIAPQRIAISERPALNS